MKIQQFKPEEFSLDTVKDVQWGLILIPVPEKGIDEDAILDTKIIFIIKQWIATKIVKVYNKDARKMMEEGKYVLQYKRVRWFPKDVIILISHNE